MDSNISNGNELVFKNIKIAAMNNMMKASKNGVVVGTVSPALCPPPANLQLPKRSRAVAAVTKEALHGTCTQRRRP